MLIIEEKYVRKAFKYMIKGCKKNVVWVKATGNEIFDEAYFILSDKYEEGRGSETDMIKAASGMINHEMMPKAQINEKKSNFCAFGKLLWFLLGATVTALLNAFLYAIL